MNTETGKFKFWLLHMLVHLIAGTSWAQNSVPSISNLTTSLDQENRIVTVSYDLWDDENDTMTVYVKISDDFGETYLVYCDSLNGDVGYPIVSGDGKQIQWFYDLPASDTLLIKIVADDGYNIDVAGLISNVDTTNLYNDLSIIEGVRHRSDGFEHLETTKDFIESQFESHGLQVHRQEFPYGIYQADNIIGRLPGQLEEEIVFIIDGHFDTVEGSPGADDNGSAVVGMLEAMRVLSGYNFSHTITFIGFDLEELPAALLGSRTYVTSGIETFETIEGVFNFEMIGYTSDEPGSQLFPVGFELLFPDIVDSAAAYDNRGNFLFNFADESSTAFMSQFDTYAAQFVPELRVLSGSAPGNAEIVPDLRRSDHTPFWDADIPALFLTDGGNFRNPHYHTPADTIGTLDFQFMANVVKAAIATVANTADIMHCSSAVSDTLVILAPVVETITQNIPATFIMFQNYPNPFNPTTTISYDLPEARQVAVAIYDISGSKIQTLVSAYQAPGDYRVQWHGVDLYGNSVSTGLYFARITAGEFSQTIKMLYLK